MNDGIVPPRTLKVPGAWTRSAGHMNEFSGERACHSRRQALLHGPLARWQPRQSLPRAKRAQRGELG